MSNWLKELVGDVPIHFSRFHPMHEAADYPVTSVETLENSKQIAVKYLSHVYIGNVRTEKHENTYCPKCKELLVKRGIYDIHSNHIKEGKCRFCKADIEGLWQ
jgi:pyruvate formate lyase activating enzyme